MIPATDAPEPSPHITALLAATDYFRGSPSRLTDRWDHKEWQHFLICTDTAHLFVNFNLIDDPRAAPPRRREAARLIVLARGATGWDGDVERFEDHEVAVTPGRIDARFGRNTLRFDRGRYHLSITLRDRPVAAELTLVPLTIPVLSPNRPLSRDRRISWMFIPRLVAHGVILAGGRAERVDAAPAYHDHNWGHFHWGDDFSWAWCSALPRDPRSPWSAVHVRMSDRGRSLIRYQGLSLWRGSTPFRIFVDEEVRVDHEGCLDLGRPLRIPRVMAMLCRGAASDVPQRIEVIARGGGDEVALRFEAADVAQIVLPSEIDPEGITVLNEVSGRVTLDGRVRGERVRMEGPGVLELVRD